MLLLLKKKKKEKNILNPGKILRNSDKDTMLK